MRPIQPRYFDLKRQHFHKRCQELRDEGMTTPEALRHLDLHEPTTMRVVRGEVGTTGTANMALFTLKDAIAKARRAGRKPGAETLHFVAERWPHLLDQ